MFAFTRGGSVFLGLLGGVRVAGAGLLRGCLLGLAGLDVGESEEAADHWVVKKRVALGLLPTAAAGAWRGL